MECLVACQLGMRDVDLLVPYTSTNYATAETKRS